MPEHKWNTKEHNGALGINRLMFSEVFSLIGRIIISMLSYFIAVILSTNGATQEYASLPGEHVTPRTHITSP